MDRDFLPKRAKDDNLIELSSSFAISSFKLLETAIEHLGFDIRDSF